MIHVTDNAKQELGKLLASKVDWPGARLRLIERSNGNLGLGVDIEAPGDHIIRHEGVDLLLVGPGLANDPKEIILDVDVTPEGTELVISENN